MSEPSDGTKPTVAQEEQKEEEEDDEEDLEKLQAEIERMEAEAARITQETQDIEKGESASNTAATKADSIKRDGCSIYVGQVDYSATPEELLAHFEACGTVERVTIVCDKMTGKPKGFAYLEFANEEAVENAMKLDGSTFKERTLKVTHKRVNDPKYKFSQEGGGGRGYRGRGGRGFRGRGRGRRGGYRGGYRGGGGRGGGHHPYY
eukprot:CAMPEP_0202481582 /NCGR_PEP_ID=MMETSP1361-20130828/1078_1 /ASSEMBLY_ACC=CAM_ASM_000849 /TAXON_ID=210615 /ORGANISM="Staurosira complex sp., Strain CCMP2646" /LENGTH=205 /DNA_ID=CAMNT_0049109097 /DNA_START=144 /DNA_END=761 /DNA_ORIENTATION=+